MLLLYHSQHHSICCLLNSRGLSLHINSSSLIIRFMGIPHMDFGGPFSLQFHPLLYPPPNRFQLFQLTQTIISTSSVQIDQRSAQTPTLCCSQLKPTLYPAKTNTQINKNKEPPNFPQAEIWAMKTFTFISFFSFRNYSPVLLVVHCLKQLPM